MPGTAKINNPYASKKAPLPRQAPSAASVPMVAAKKSSVPKAVKTDTIPSKPAAPKLNPSPIDPFAKKKTFSLKAKLKKQIEELKRQKLLQKQRIEERKRRKLQKKMEQRQRAEETEKSAQQTKLQAQQSTPAIKKADNFVPPTATPSLPTNTTPSADVSFGGGNAVTPHGMTPTTGSVQEAKDVLNSHSAAGSPPAARPSPHLVAVTENTSTAKATPAALASVGQASSATALQNLVTPSSKQETPAAADSLLRLVPSCAAVETAKVVANPMTAQTPVPSGATHIAVQAEKKTLAAPVSTTATLQEGSAGPVKSSCALTNISAVAQIAAPQPMPQAVAAPLQPNAMPMPQQAMPYFGNPLAQQLVLQMSAPMANTVAPTNSFSHSLTGTVPMQNQNGWQQPLTTQYPWAMQNLSNLQATLYQHNPLQMVPQQNFMYRNPVNPFCQPSQAPMHHIPGYASAAWSHPAFAATLPPAHQPVPIVRRSRPRATSSSITGNHVSAERLTATPCRSPAPFAATHTVYSETLLLVKKSGETGFGLTVRNHKESALVGPEEWPLAGEAAIEKTTATENTDEKSETKVKEGGAVNPALVAVKQVRRRRRRVFFSVMQVLNPAEQNERTHPLKKKDLRVEEEDIILTIQGKETAGLTFQEACALFKQVGKVDENGCTVCEVTVARKLPPKPKLSLPKIIVPKVSDQPHKETPIGAPEILALAGSVITALTDPRRVPGRKSNVIDASLAQLLATLLHQETRSLETWQAAWSQIAQHMQYQMLEKAVEHWQREWQLEPPSIRSMKLLTDARRSELRARPRPVKGCRCGSKEHEYVNDPAVCPLYSNLYRLKEENPTEGSLGSSSKKSKTKLDRDLGAVETAFKERIERIKAEESAQEAEARFVGEMEDLQLKKCGQAIFAPSLATIVLSAVVDLEPQFRNWKPLPIVEELVPEPREETIVKNNCGDNDNDDDSDDDDDVPLAALGKRESSGGNAKQKKKARIEPMIQRAYIAKLLRYVSDRWGHVYREPSDLDYAWRWEVHTGGQGETSESARKVSSKNPRGEGSLSLENIRFLLTNEILVQLADPSSVQALAFAMSTTAVYEELQALLQSSIVRVNPAGIPVLAKDWYVMVDLLLLDDMDLYWSIKADPAGKYGVAEKIRQKLDKEWKKTSYGWALADSPKEIIHDFGEYDEWRDAFEDKQQTQADTTEGVGRFGI